MTTVTSSSTLSGAFRFFLGVAGTDALDELGSAEDSRAGEARAML